MISAWPVSGHATWPQRSFTLLCVSGLSSAKRHRVVIKTKRVCACSIRTEVAQNKYLESISIEHFSCSLAEVYIDSLSLREHIQDGGKRKDQAEQW